MKIEFVQKNLSAIKADFELIFIQEKNSKQLNAYKDFFKLYNYKGEGICLDGANKRLFV